MVDNVPFHKVAGVEEAIQAVCASLRYLPKYSPDLNPIELRFHPLKTWLRNSQLQGCTDVLARTFARSALLNAWVTFDIPAMNHYDRDAL